MGGNAFKTLPLERIKRENINSTLQYVSDNIPVTFDYMINNMLGSAGKQEDSGDLDIALNKETYSKETLRNISEIVRAKYGDQYASTKTMNGGQIQTAWPIVGQDGLVQVDFIVGNAEWLKFTHYSPGKDRSPYKGVFVSQCLGVVAKMKREWVYPIGAELDDRNWEISWAYNLERGLQRRWRARKQPDQNLANVSADWFETHCPVIPPRFIRTGFIDNPDEAVRILFGEGVTREDIDTFEKLWALLKATKSAEYMEQLEERFFKSFFKSGGRREFTLEGLKELPVFN